jgi:hypothetical protein
MKWWTTICELYFLFKKFEQEISYERIKLKKIISKLDSLWKTKRWRIISIFLKEWNKKYCTIYQNWKSLFQDLILSEEQNDDELFQFSRENEIKSIVRYQNWKSLFQDLILSAEQKRWRVISIFLREWNKKYRTIYQNWKSLFQDLILSAEQKRWRIISIFLRKWDKKYRMKF